MPPRNAQKRRCRRATQVRSRGVSLRVPLSIPICHGRSTKHATRRLRSTRRARGICIEIPGKSGPHSAKAVRSGDTVWNAAQRDVRGGTECANPHVTATASNRLRELRPPRTTLGIVREGDHRISVSLVRWSGWGQAAKERGPTDDVRPATADAGGSSPHQRHSRPSNARNRSDRGTAQDTNERCSAAGASGAVVRFRVRAVRVSWSGGTRGSPQD